MRGWVTVRDLGKQDPFPELLRSLDPRVDRRDDADENALIRFHVIVNGLQDVDAVGLIRQCNVNEVACGPGRIGCVGVFCLECVNEDSSPREPGMRVAGDISSEPEITTSNGNGRPPNELTEYEAEQVREIAAWKSRPPNPFGELFKRITRPASSLVERVLPDNLVKVAIDRAFDVAHRAADGVAHS